MRTIPQAVFDTKEAKKAAKLGHEQACSELAKVPRNMLDPSNPNHPDYDLHIFGEHYKDFIKRQY